jgi:hypothetical protein
VDLGQWIPSPVVGIHEQVAAPDLEEGDISLTPADMRPLARFDEAKICPVLRPLFP